MQLWPVKLLNLWWVGILFLTVTGCGKIGGAGQDPLDVKLEIPAGEVAEVFWFNVDRKVLAVKRGNEESSYPWAASQETELDLREGDTLSFSGFDGRGLLLVTGEAKVGPSKLVSIRVHRIL